MAQARHAEWLSVFRRDGRHVCQECDHTRRPEHRGEKNLSVKVDESGVTARCHHCGGTFAHQFSYEETRMQSNVAPMERPSFTSADRLSDHEPLTQEGRAYLSGRGISDSTMELYGVRSASRFYRSKRQAPEGKFPSIGFLYQTKDRHYATKWRCIPHRNFVSDGAAHTMFGPDWTEGDPLILTEGECFPADAEVLTPDGWVRFEDYHGGPVAQWDAGLVSFVEPTARVVKPFTGNLVSLRNGSWRSVTTPGHRIPRMNAGGALSFITAEDAMFSTWGSVPRTGVGQGAGIDLTDDQIALCLAISADAKIDTRKNGSRYAHFGLKKERKTLRLRSILERLGLAFREVVAAAGNSIGYTYFSMTVPDWCPGRSLPMAWATGATPDQREFILREMVHWDGNSVPNRSQTEYSTKRKDNADFMQAVAHLAGRVSTIIKRTSDLGSWMKVSILHAKNNSSLQGMARTASLVPYDGYVYCVTVPSGAILVRQNDAVTVSGNCDAMSVHTATGMVAHSLPNGSNDNGTQGDKLKFLNNNFDVVKAATKVILVMDQDKAGAMMAEELSRRIGRSKVWRVTLPPGRKDANEVLVSDGPAALKQAIDSAEPWPIEGMTRVYDAADKVRHLHQHGMPPGKSTGWRDVDKVVTIQAGMLYIVTGIPGHGKSTWVDNLMVNLAVKSGWTFAIGSFETPTELGIARMISVRQGVPFASLSPAEVETQLDWAQEHFHFLTSDGLVTVDSLIERTEAAVTRYGVKMMVIDPYNYVRTPGQEMGTEAVNELLSKLKAFAVAMDIAIFLVAHPAKPQSGSEDWVPTGYDISGSANFYNRADFGLTMSRARGSAELEGDAFLTVWKCKWAHLGKTGKAWLDFDSSTERFTERGTPLALGNSNPFVW